MELHLKRYSGRSSSAFRDIVVGRAQATEVHGVMHENDMYDRIIHELHRMTSDYSTDFANRHMGMNIVPVIVTVKVIQSDFRPQNDAIESALSDTMTKTKKNNNNNLKLLL